MENIALQKKPGWFDFNFPARKNVLRQDPIDEKTVGASLIKTSTQSIGEGNFL